MFYEDDGIVVKVEHIVDIPSDEDEDTIKGLLRRQSILSYFVFRFS